MKVRTLARTALALFALFGLNAVQAKEPPKQTKPAIAPVQVKQDADPALWVVKDKDTTIYLFGTVHVLKPGLSWFDEAVKTAFDKSGTLMLEVVLPDDPKQLQGLVMSKALNMSGPSLSDKLTPDARKAMDTQAARLGVPVAALDRFDPWFASLMLSQTALKKAGYDSENGAEKQLTKAAKAENKPVKGLETMEQQFGYLDGLDPKLQIVMLNQTVAQLPEIDSKIGDMIADWGQGKPDALAKLMNEDMRATPQIAKILLTDRNARWAKWIAERMKQPGTVFIAVGAGHLAGSGSVQDQLRAYHLKAKRINY